MTSRALPAVNLAIVNTLIAEMGLPDSFHDIVRGIYLPLIELILSQKQTAPLFVCINGAQGTGKSTLTTFLKHIIEAQQNYRVAALSLDDFYHTLQSRQLLAKRIHPLLITRGVPGTHDLKLMVTVIGNLLQGLPSNAPRFNKAIDDRYSESEWLSFDQPVDFVLFEGWCNNSPPQTSEELIKPINVLEEHEDQEGIWRTYSNDMLIEYHRLIFDYTDVSIMLKAPDFEHVYTWRRLQEQKLRNNTPKKQRNGLMDDTQLVRFIQHYERITRHTLAYLPGRADVVLPIAEDHSITGIENNCH